MKKIILLWGALTFCTFSFAQTEVFINEIHYENIGGDLNEGVEIAGPAGTDLTGWRLVFYNGAGGTVYDTETLIGTIPNLQNNRGTIWFAHLNIQNDMEGIALVNPLDNVVQFLSYEGSFVATDGLAIGLSSVNIGVEESDATTVIGHSLQLTGSGANYEDFTWALPNTTTQGLINNAQTFAVVPAILSNNYIVSSLNYEVGSGSSNEGSFIIEGSNLTNDIIINSLSNFEISDTSGGSFSTSITLFKGAGTTIIPTTIYARLKSGLNIGSYSENVVVTSTAAISKTVVLSGNVAPNVGSIIITEIMKNPTKVTDNDGEYFEVYNTTGTDIDMNGWVISDDGGSTHTINLPVLVLSGSYAVFGINSDINTNGGFTVNYQYVSTFGLVNTDDEIILKTPAEMGSVIIDQVYYDDTNFPNINGESMELHLYKYDAVSNNIGSNWGTATSSYGDGDLGTPGTNNNFGLSVVKNEIENFVMYPNPVSNGSLYLSSANRLSKRIQIYTLNGQQVYGKNVELEETIDVSNINKGIYLIRIEEEGKIATRKLIVD